MHHEGLISLLVQTPIPCGSGCRGRPQNARVQTRSVRVDGLSAHAKFVAILQFHNRSTAKFVAKPQVISWPKPYAARVKECAQL